MADKQQQQQQPPDESGLSKAELRKARKDAKKEVKDKKVAKAVERAEKEETQPPKEAKQSKQKTVPPQTKSVPPQPEKPAAPVKPAPPAAPVASTAPEQLAAAVKPIVTMFMSDFPDDWTSGAVPLLAALHRLLEAIALQDEHDCLTAVNSTKENSNGHGAGGGADEMLRHFDEAHLRPFLASNLGLVINGANNPSNLTTTCVTPLRKALLCVGHLAVIKWVRELVFSRRIDASQGPTLLSAVPSGAGNQQQKSPLGIVDFLSSLSDALYDIYIERIQLAADGVCRFGSEILASCTTSRPLSPALPFQPLQTMSSFPSSLLVTLATCSCGSSPCSCSNRPPVISHLVSRALAMTDTIIEKQRHEGGDDRDDKDGKFHPPCLTVAVATPGCCANKYQQGLFDHGELGLLESIAVFPVPLSRIGSAIANGSVSAVLLPADAVLANRGCAVLAPRGAGMLALAARAQWHCPVIVLAETYKIIAGGQEEIEETLKGLVPPSVKTAARATPELYMEDADVISADSISVVVTELGAVPAAALPSILRLSQKARPSRGGLSATAKQEVDTKTP